MANAADVPESVARGGRALGRHPSSWVRPIFGLSAADRFVVRFDDGSTAFVKAATDAQTDAWLRNERNALTAVGGVHGPSVLAFEPGAADSLLVTEDLSHGYWPAHDHRVEWRPGDIDALLATLGELGAAPVPEELAPIADWPPPQWATVFDRGVLPASGLCSDRWTEAAAPAISRLDEVASFEPTAFAHGDVRSDNVVILDGRARLVDWSSAGLGDPCHDLAQLLPTLHLEGAPEPWRAAEVPAELVVRLGGSVARRVADPQGAPEWLRRVFLRLTAINLEWIAVLLGLEPPDGRHWRDI